MSVKKMSFIRLGRHLFNKSKIACIDVHYSECGLYRLRVMYDTPCLAGMHVYDERIINVYSPMMKFDIVYHGNARNSLLGDIDSITHNNPTCFLEKGAIELLQEKYNRE